MHTQQRHTPSRLQWMCFLCQQKTFQLSHNICFRGTVPLKSPTGSQTIPSGFFCSHFQHVLQLVCSRWDPCLGRGCGTAAVARSPLWWHTPNTGQGFWRRGPGTPKIGSSLLANWKWSCSQALPPAFGPPAKPRRFQETGTGATIMRKFMQWSL